MHGAYNVKLLNFFVPLNISLYFTVVRSYYDIAPKLSNICTQPKNSKKKVQTASPTYSCTYLFDGLHLLFDVRISQRDVINKDIRTITFTSSFHYVLC